MAWSTYGQDIAAIRARGGDVIPSFGGYSADHGGTDIADSCPSAQRIAAAYEQVVTTYGVTRLDLDVEDRSLHQAAAIARRNQAIHLVQQWAARTGRTVEFAYTLPSSMAGLDPAGVGILRDAQRQGADDPGGQRHDVRLLRRRAARDGSRQHRGGHGGLRPADARSTRTVPRAQLWSRLGVTEMVGIDDFGPAETLTVADARTVTAWASAHHIAVLSFWALQRDSGACPGEAGSDSCSGVAQRDWEFSRAFERFS